jgi:hypothetical protein
MIALPIALPTSSAGGEIRDSVLDLPGRRA